MSAWAVGISVATLAVSLALPGLLLAQEPVPPPQPEAPPAAADSEAGTPPPPDGGEPEAAQTVDGDPPAAEAPAPARATTKAPGSVGMVDFAFSPASVTVNVGDSVTWSNGGEEPHTATGSGFDTGAVAPGASASATFSTAGSFSYICEIHPFMKGTVVVDGPSPTSAAGGPTDAPGAAEPTISEADAGTAPGAAGTGDALPATGEDEAPLLILGAGLLACGALAAAQARRRQRESELLPSAGG